VPAQPLVRSSRALSRRRSLLVALTALISAAVLALASTASATVLYDQTDGSPNGSVLSLSSDNFAASPEEESKPCGPTATSCYAADDFTVPPGPAWYVKNVHVDGTGGSGDLLSWEALASSNPPAPEQGGLGAFALPPPPVALASGSNYGQPSGSDDFDMPTGVGIYAGTALPPGHYWLSASASPSKSGTPASEWKWETRSGSDGSAAVWSSVDCGSQAAYKPLTDCGQPGTEMRFRIEGEVLDSSFSGLTVGKTRRTPDGGVNIPVELSGLPERPGVVVKKVKGKGKVSTLAKEGWTIVKGAPAPGQLGPNGEVPVVVKVRPSGATATALKAGKKIKMVLSITYTRRVNSFGPITIPSMTKKVAVLLKKVR
jgi:hypothetical protein